VSGSQVDILARALAERQPARLGDALQRAAVALVLREPGPGAELLFITRAEHPGDPWSGQVGFPGGRAEPGDVDLVATAVRETLEETGLDLAGDADLLGGLDEVRALARGRPVDLVIAPFVFRLRRLLGGSPSHEAVSLHWVPLATLLDERTRSTLEYEHEGLRLELPCLRTGDLLIWGLTYRMFASVASILGGAAPPPPGPPHTPAE
jgi:8-oxo-dGTP pyrophosphatase MutT (NUDIX family)